MNVVISCRTLCRDYFASGWMLLLPYSAAFLIYGHMGWGAHDTVAGRPSLLNLFEGIHLVHVFMAVLACTGRRARDGRGETAAAPTWLSWLGLALLFVLPGIYLEWPSDPWDHLRRISEWDLVNNLSAHSAWPKASYFLYYSLSGGAGGAYFSTRLLLVYSALCLLLCWQYYLLGRSLRLDPVPAFIAALGACVLLGNSAFSFTRYYGLSSSLAGQIATVAMIRVAVELANEWRPRRLVELGLLAFIAYSNHPQAVLAGSLGLASVAAWKITLLRRCKVLLAAMFVLLSGAAWFIPRTPAWTTLVVRPGWSASWDGLAVFTPDSPAFERAWLILGAAGIINVLAALWLLRSRHPVAWLTLGPLVLLASPAVAIPLLNALIEGNQPILVFHRVLLAVPPGFALVVVGTKLWSQTLDRSPRLAQPLALITLLALVALPPSPRWFGRLYHLIARIGPVNTRAEERIRAEVGFHDSTPKPWAVPAVDFGLRAAGYRTAREAQREIWTSPVQQVQQLRDAMEQADSPLVLVTIDETSTAASPSTMAMSSGHWPKEAAAAALAGQPELRAWAQDWSEPQRVGPVLIQRTGSSYTFLTLAGSASLRPDANSVIAIGVSPSDAVLDIRGDILTGGLGGRYAFPPPSDGKLRLRASAGDVLVSGIETSSDFDLKNAQVVVRQRPHARTAPEPGSASEVGLLENVRLVSRGTNDGMTLRIPLDHKRRHVFTIRGSGTATVPQLRVRGTSTAGGSLARELPLSGPGIRFSVRDAKQIELEIIFALAGEYRLQKISVQELPLNDPPAVADIFEGTHRAFPLQ